ncbi:MAG TPA: hypothetical protein VE127_04815, partial [Solirubrobacteraceae bacterium]|nr:hypothetical protein [Solirubrobacteraceae bacterium]
EDGRGTLRDVLKQCTEAGFSIAEVNTHRLEREVNGVRAVAVDLELYGQPRVDPLASALNDVGGVLEVAARDLADTE